MISINELNELRKLQLAYNVAKFDVDEAKKAYVSTKKDNDDVTMRCIKHYWATGKQHEEEVLVPRFRAIVYDALITLNKAESYLLKAEKALFEFVSKKAITDYQQACLCDEKNGELILQFALGLGNQSNISPKTEQDIEYVIDSTEKTEAKK